MGYARYLLVSAEVVLVTVDFVGVLFEGLVQVDNAEVLRVVVLDAGGLRGDLGEKGDGETERKEDLNGVA